MDNGTGEFQGERLRLRLPWSESCLGEGGWRFSSSGTCSTFLDFVPCEHWRWTPTSVSGSRLSAITCQPSSLLFDLEVECVGRSSHPRKSGDFQYHHVNWTCPKWQTWVLLRGTSIQSSLCDLNYLIYCSWASFLKMLSVFQCQMWNTSFSHGLCCCSFPVLPCWFALHGIVSHGLCHSENKCKFFSENTSKQAIIMHRF